MGRTQRDGEGDGVGEKDNVRMEEKGKKDRQTEMEGERRETATGQVKLISEIE